MISFNAFKINEIATEHNIDYGRYFDKSLDFKKEIESKKFLKLVDSNLGSIRYKIYKITGETTTYYLSSENDEYLGSIEIKKNRIKTSHSKIKRGFYHIMFVSILSDGIDEIFSDHNLSTQVIKTYDSLDNNDSFCVRVFDGKYHKFSREKILENPRSVVSVMAKIRGTCLVEDYYEKISDDWKKYYEIRSPALDILLYDLDLSDGNLWDNI